MSSIHKLTETFARLRGTPVSTVDAYVRALRRGGVLPETKRGSGATPATAENAVDTLCAIARGSPAHAAENANTIGDLVPHAPAMMDVVLRHFLEALGWPREITFREAVAHLIRASERRQLDALAIVDGLRGVTIAIDRYRPRAHIRFFPAPQLVEALRRGFEEAFPGIDPLPMPDRRLDGTLVDAWSLDFASPDLFDAEHAEGAYRREARRRRTRTLDRFAELDLGGEEFVTLRTISALGDAFRYAGVDVNGYPLDPAHAWNRDLPDDEREQRLADIERIVSKRYATEGLADA